MKRKEKKKQFASEKKVRPTKRKINSKQKGSRVERMLVIFLKECGIASARRTEQYCGNTGDASDVVADELPSYHIECKGTKSQVLNYSKLKAWLAQLKTDCPSGKIPILFWKANGVDWVLLMPDTTSYRGVWIELQPENLLKEFIEWDKDRLRPAELFSEGTSPASPANGSSQSPQTTAPESSPDNPNFHTSADIRPPFVE